jgi:hypothetical protein
VLAAHRVGCLPPSSQRRQQRLQAAERPPFHLGNLPTPKAAPQPAQRFVVRFISSCPQLEGETQILLGRDFVESGVSAVGGGW